MPTLRFRYRTGSLLGCEIIIEDSVEVSDPMSLADLEKLIALRDRVTGAVAESKKSFKLDVKEKPNA